MDLVGCMDAALALATDGAKVSACLDRLAAGAIQLALGHCRTGADAVLISSAYAGAGFISPEHYARFVLPSERKVVAGVKAAYPDKPVYTHTCGAIGDRLELMAQTGTDGIDTLDPPPLGTVDLADAKARIGSPPLSLFIKGNVDPVHTIWRGTPEACFQDALARITIAAPGGGYILSTACSVPPHAPAENIVQLARAAAEAPAAPQAQEHDSAH
jgi:uroporphyrinogen decarboxylase